MEIDAAKLLVFDFKLLTLASETLIFARTAEINCYYLMTLFCGAQLKVPNHFVLPIANPFLLCPDV